MLVAADIFESSVTQKVSTAGVKKQKAPKKEKEKRQNAWGSTVPFSSKPSQKVKERMARAMPGVLKD